MPSPVRASRALDVLTAVVLVLALVAFAQPGSVVRQTWARYRARVATSNALSLHWGAIVRHSIPMHADSSAPVVVEISNYQCPFCRLMSPIVDSALTAGLRISHLHASNPARPLADSAAVAAMCAARDGHFVEMHRRLMETNVWERDSNWRREASAAGVTDLDAFESCMLLPGIWEQLHVQHDLVKSIFVGATPTFVAGTHHIQGTLSLSRLADLHRAAAGRSARDTP